LSKRIESERIGPLKAPAIDIKLQIKADLFELKRKLAKEPSIEPLAGLFATHILVSKKRRVV
jgi:hypothetical protein